MGCPPLSGPLHTHCTCLYPSLVCPNLQYLSVWLAVVLSTTMGPQAQLRELSLASQKMCSEELLCHGVIVLELLGEQQAVSPELTPCDIPAPRDGSNSPPASSTLIIFWVPCIAATLMGARLKLAIILSCIFLTISHVEHLFMCSLAVCVSS